MNKNKIESLKVLDKEALLEVKKARLKTLKLMKEHFDSCVKHFNMTPEYRLPLSIWHKTKKIAVKTTIVRHKLIVALATIISMIEFEGTEHTKQIIGMVAEWMAKPLIPAISQKAQALIKKKIEQERVVLIALYNDYIAQKQNQEKEKLKKIKAAAS